MTIFEGFQTQSALFILLKPSLCHRSEFWTNDVLGFWNILKVKEAEGINYCYDDFCIAFLIYFSVFSVPGSCGKENEVPVRSPAAMMH